MIHCIYLVVIFHCFRLKKLDGRTIMIMIVKAKWVQFECLNGRDGALRPGGPSVKRLAGCQRRSWGQCEAPVSKLQNEQLCRRTRRWFSMSARKLSSRGKQVGILMIWSKTGNGLFSHGDKNMLASLGLVMSLTWSQSRPGPRLSAHWGSIVLFISPVPIHSVPV